MIKVAQWLGRKQWFASAGRKLVPADLAVQRRTGGRIGLARLAGLSSMLLTTTGRRSGLPREVPLLYVPHGDDFLVVGSNWGQASHPAWSANLLAHPEAEVDVISRRVPVRAVLLTGEERERLWHEVVLPFWPAYADYARRAGGRELRVFRLTPR
ncbi:nitroreductase family deazaflavin-dependent oxidoreductase [Saccharopolyspora gregorii]|uniref:Nitroreductase family deazaflavin-dependent oxidoreductase n=1 Tax=Saccharopolyspora gregorii TaxID=33914 RepID=A0ABP6RRM9_9PSEU|nr:nitroreductase family deazaflavin-dependent oxidoreductase [Saccharopolyspora gregorii]